MLAALLAVVDDGSAILDLYHSPLGRELPCTSTTWSRHGWRDVPDRHLGMQSMHLETKVD